MSIPESLDLAKGNQLKKLSEKKKGWKHLLHFTQW
jgi:hypothetical protein